MWARLVSTLAIILAAGAVCAGEGRTVKVLIISGDHGHDWRKTTPFLKELLTKAGHKVDVTLAPSKDLTPDIGGKGSTQSFTDRVIAALNA